MVGFNHISQTVKAIFSFGWQPPRDGVLKKYFFPQDIEIMGWCLVESSGVSLTSWREGASLSLADHLSSDGATIKNTYQGREVSLHWPALHPIFSYWVS